MFPDQALGRPVIGTRRGDRHRHRAGRARLPRRPLHGPQHGGGRGRQRHPRARHGDAERLLGGLSSAAAEDASTSRRGRARPTLVVKEKATEQYHLCLGGPGLSRNDPRRHAQSVLDTVLGGSMSSRLFQEVREKRGLAYSVGLLRRSATPTRARWACTSARARTTSRRPARSSAPSCAASAREPLPPERAAARQGPPQGPPGAGHGELGHPDEPHRPGRAHGHRAADGRRDRSPASTR